MATLLLLAIALGALALRVSFLLGPGGPLASPTDYDDGVYFSVSALLVRGVVPYRDFVFVHPPGIAWFYAPVSWWPDPAIGFAIARVLACIAGAASTLLVGLLVRRTGSTLAAAVAAALYALYPDAVTVEHSAFLEPVLNLACLASALVWLRDDGRAKTSGALAGYACTTKLLGGIWVVAALASAPRGRLVRDGSRFVLGSILAGLIFLAPLALLAPSSFLAQVLRFQLSRPPDGTPAVQERLAAMHLAQPVAAWLCAIAVLAMLVKTAMRERVSREERFFLVATLLTAIAFLASSSYWTQYNSYLAPAQCVLAGLGVASLLRLPRARFAVAAVVLAAVAWGLWPQFRHIRDAAGQRSEEAIALRRASRTLPPSLSLFAFDPSWSLVAGRLPAHGDGAPVIVDSYAAMLMEATGQGHASAASAAFRAAASQPDVRLRLEKSPLVITGWRGDWQMTDDDRAWVRAHFVCVTPEAGELCVRQRVRRPIDSIAKGIAFGDGWYGQEGAGADTWRWMSRRGVMVLPPVHGDAQLSLEFAVPLDALPAHPTVTVSIDGRVVDRVTANGSTLIRTIPVRGNGRPMTLAIETDRTFVPARAGNSTDARELGLRLHRV
ncbi:MAG TPA: glycosyltransferase family 87 protein, partial [Thermoanaerobaculia bacterium]|nr:glycosyltransferase family 87 protein [Thermoanaerobaculia bacterium]